MRPIDRIRADPAKVRHELELRGFDAPLDRIIELDERSRQLTSERDVLRAERNKASKGGPPSEEVRVRMREVGERVKVIESELSAIDQELEERVQWIPNSGQYWSVPDVYSARLGAAFSVLPDQGVTVSLGGRIDGIPVRDLIGGGDDSTIKRASYVVFADPGLSLSLGRGTLTLSAPYRVRVNRQKSLLEQRTGALNAGGFAKYLVFVAYSHRL